ESNAVAKWFLKNKPDVWTKWVPADVATRVQSAL
ncbi:MAG: glycine/betaine ABC transporter substrate-binding protein, partial [Alcaligenes sp.]